ncbi:regulatory protein [Salmonella enterica subsp. enterica]|uniref:Regulatory protein n=1 Tax=Salmonella enterica I TaxID=59201 RepID=A0A3S5DD32_SALET|nr:regulatory protein [Salmonella enterica subsp. enterica]
MVIPEVRQERLYQKIANLIIKLINDNIFPPGTFLPPERELAKQLGVSRASLREALIVLEISGWIVIQSGNGVIVSDKKHLCQRLYHRRNSSLLASWSIAIVRA